jgi:DnaJ-class molecular chaperone
MPILIVIGIIAGFGYYLSLRIHPLTKCKVCNGGGRHFGTVYASAHRRCRKCGGSGRQDRLGVRLFLGGTDGTGVFTKR